MQNLANFFELSSDPLCLLDTACKVQQLNPAFSQNLGWKHSAPQPFSFFQLFPGAHAALIASALARAPQKAPSPLSFHSETLHHDGSRRLMKWTQVSVHRGQRCLMGQYIATNPALSQKQASLQTKDKLYAIIAHDLRNFLGQSQMLSQLLYEQLAQKQQPHLTKLAAQNAQTSQHLLFLLENLLSWTQAQGENLLWSPENILLAPWVEEVVDLFQPLAQTKEIRLAVTTNELISFQGDRQIMSAILRNLLSNALKFTHAGGTVHVHVYQHMGQTWLSVEDNGIGIPSKQLSQLLDPKAYFVRPGTAREKGSGLGIRLCQDLIRLYQGQFKVQSEAGKGTRMTVSLPGKVERSGKPSRIAVRVSA